MARKIILLLTLTFCLPLLLPNFQFYAVAASYAEEMSPYESLYIAEKKLRSCNTADVQFYIDEAVKSKYLTAVGISAFFSADCARISDNLMVSRYIPTLLDAITQRYEQALSDGICIGNDEISAYHRLIRKYSQPITESTDENLQVHEGTLKSDEPTDLAIVRKESDASIGIINETPLESSELDSKPQYIGNLAGELGVHCIYPSYAKKDNAEGSVWVNFIVNKDGRVANIKVTRGVHPLLNVTAVNAVSKLGKWNPGEKGGKKVASKLTLPISFKIPE